MSDSVHIISSKIFIFSIFLFLKVKLEDLTLLVFHENFPILQDIETLNHQVKHLLMSKLLEI